MIWQGLSAGARGCRGLGSQSAKTIIWCEQNHITGSGTTAGETSLEISILSLPLEKQNKKKKQETQGSKGFKDLSKAIYLSDVNPTWPLCDPGHVASTLWASSSLSIK